MRNYLFIILIFLIHKSKSDQWFSGELSVLQKFYDNCAKSQDVTYCLKNKAAIAIERALSRNLSITDNLILARNNVSSETTNPNLDPDERITRALGNLMETHTFKVDLSDYETETESRGYDDDAEYDDTKHGHKKRKQKKRVSKVLPYLLMAKLAAMSIFGPMAVKILTLIAGKALIASKVALVISGMILLKKVFQSDHHESATFQVHTVPDNHRREFDSSNDPYRSYRVQK